MSSFGAQLRGVLQALVANRLIIATAMVSNVLFSKFCRFHFSYKSLLKNASKSQFLELGRRDPVFGRLFSVLAVRSYMVFCNLWLLIAL